LARFFLELIGLYSSDITIRYNTGYDIAILTCAEKLTGNQNSPPHIAKKTKTKTKN